MRFPSGFIGAFPANRGGISIIALSIITATGYKSWACASNPNLCASNGIAPPPANGSSTDAVWSGYREYINMGAARKTGYRYLITDDEAKTFRIKVMFDAKVDDREVAS